MGKNDRKKNRKNKGNKNVEKRDLLDENGKFKKGNPGGPGRPQGSLSIVQRLRKKLDEFPKGEEKKYADLVVERWLNEALVTGDFKALREIVRYIDGMPKQKTDITSDGEKINRVEISIVDPEGKDDGEDSSE